MAFWIKGVNDPEIMIRRYHCPQCNHYSLHIKYEAFGECEQGCFITDSQVIDKLIEDQNFEGIFSEEELKYNFI